MKYGARYKRYPRYKDSGVEWLSQIPAHWTVRPLKWCGRITGGAGFPHEYQGVERQALPFYKVGDLGKSADQRTVGESADTVSLETAGQLRADLIPAGAVIYAKIGAALLLNRRRLTTRPCCIDNNMSAFIPKEVDPCWSFYWMSVLDFRALANPGAVPSLSEGYQVTLPFVSPPLDEQRAIGEFLDRETAKIDALIARKERLIELLEEKRTALITHAVTRGLNPDAPLRDSGIEWLGQIPAHWEVVVLKRVASIRYGLGQPPRESTNGLPMIRATDLHSGKINTHGLMCVDPRDVPWDRNPQLKENEIIVVRSGAYTGDSAIIPPELAGAISGYDLVLTATKADPKFLACVLLSRYFLESQIDLIRLRAAQPHLNAEELGMCILIQPPIAEQHQIVDRIERATAQMEAVASKVSAAIETLREYRSAIITAAVTGKIDVTKHKP